MPARAEPATRLWTVSRPSAECSRLDAHEIDPEAPHQLGRDRTRRLDERADERLSRSSLTRTLAERLTNHRRDDIVAASSSRKAQARCRTRRGADCSTRSTPSSPPPTRPHIAGRPTSTARAPSASEMSTSVPRRIPPSTSTSISPPTAATTSGSASSEAGAASNWRPPWFETTIADAPCSTREPGVLGSEDPLEHEREPRPGHDPARDRPSVSEGSISAASSAGEAGLAVDGAAGSASNSQALRESEIPLDSPVAAAEHRAVDGQDDRLEPGLGSLPDQVCRELPVAQAVDLEPESGSRGMSGDLGRRGFGDRRDAHHRLASGRPTGSRELPVAVQEGLKTDRSDQAPGTRRPVRAPRCGSTSRPTSRSTRGRRVSRANAARFWASARSSPAPHAKKA